tara:strand:+ start:1003 stop:1686 length:684 start_codon:yes stop_codon:yes gene_type:complete
MAKEFKLEIEKREQHGKQAMKRLRNEGKIPGVFYTADSKNSTSFVMDSSQIDLAVKSGARIFNISVGGKKQIVIFKSVQYHPITDSITHVDLYGVRMDQAIVIKVPIVLNGIAVGVQNEGGILNQAAAEIDIRCLPGDIPESIELDITDLKIGDSLNVGSISVADNIEIVANEDMVIVSVTVPMREEEVVESTEDTEFMDSEGDVSEEDKSGAPSEESSNENKGESE